MFQNSIKLIQCDKTYNSVDNHVRDDKIWRHESLSMIKAGQQNVTSLGISVNNHMSSRDDKM